MADSTIKKYLDQAAAQALVNEIKSRDAATLQAAKDYCDGKDDQFEVAGAGKTAEENAKKYTDEKITAANEAIALKADKTALEAEVTRATEKEGELADSIAAVDEKADANAEAIAAINDTEDGILAQAKKFATEEDVKVQANIDALAGKVGTVPEDQTVMGIIEKIQSEAYDDTAIRNLISGLEANKADKTQVATDIADAVKAETDARVLAVQGVQDSVNELAGTHGTDKKALEDAIALKADQTALDDVAAVANAAATAEALAAEVKRAGDEEARIVGLVEAEAERAAGAEEALDERLVKVETFFEKAEDETISEALDTLVEIQAYITGEGAAADEMVKDIAANAKAIEDMDAAYKLADEALQDSIEELAGVVAEKAAASDVETLKGEMDAVEGRLDAVEPKVETLEGEMDDVQAAVATKAEAQDLTDAVEALEGADAELLGKIEALEGKFTGEGSVEDQIADAKQEAIDAAAEDATEKANAAEEAAKGHADSLNTAMNTRVEALEAIDHEHANKALLDTYTQTEANLADAVAKKHEHANKAVLDGITAEKVAAWDAAEQNAKDYADDLDEAMTIKVDAIDARLIANETKAGANETAIANLTTKHNEDKATLNAAIEANTAAINSFAAITAEEITAMFAASAN